MSRNIKPGPVIGTYTAYLPAPELFTASTQEIRGIGIDIDSP